MSYLYHGRRWLILLFAFLYLFNYFAWLPNLFVFNCILLVCVILQAVAGLPRVNRLVCSSLVLIGSIVLLYSGASLRQWMEAFYTNAGLVTLFVAVPLIRLPFFYEDYQDELKHVAQKHLRNILGFCALTAVIIHGAAVMISIASIPLVYELLKGNAELYKAKRPFLASLLQGYMTSGFWSPAWASVAVVTYQLNLPWLAIVPLGLTFTVLTIGLSLLWNYIEMCRSPEGHYDLKPDPTVVVNWRHIRILLALAAGMIALVVIFNVFTSWSILVIVPIVALIFPVITALIQRKIPQFLLGIQNYYKNSIMNINNEMVLFAAAGFLGKSLEFAGVSKIIPQLIPSWLSQYHFLTILFLMLIIVLVSLTGIHPVVTGSTLVGAIDPLSLHLTPLVFGFTILSGWAIGVMVSPFSAMSLITAGLEKTTSWKIGLGINGPFGLVLLPVLALFLSLLLFI